MKKLVQITMMLFFAIAVTSCACNKGDQTVSDDEAAAALVETENDAHSDTDEQTEENENAVLNEAGGYGMVIDANNAVEIPALLAKMGDAPSIEGKVKATVGACCQAKGCWMDLEYGEGESMRVTFRDYEFFVPYDLPGSDVIIQGTAQLDTLSVDYLRHLAEDAGKSADEIEAINEPSIEVVFVADGVLPVEG